MRKASPVRAWLQASRLPSQTYIFLPLLLGQLLWVASGGQFSWGAFVCVQLFGLFDQLYIVYANDYADRHDDPLNKTFNMFSGGSRVLVDGLLSPRQLANAAVAMAALSIACSVVLALVFASWLTVPLAVTGLLLLFLYSYPPARMSYRGAGEVLQMIGVGLVLPLFGYVAQSGELLSFPWHWLAVLLPTHLGCAINTSLPDRPSDQTSSKKTAAVLLGLGRAKLAVFLLNMISLLTLPLALRGVHPISSAWFVGAVPMAANIAYIILWRSAPGSRRLNTAVMLGVLFTVSLNVGIAVALLLAA